MIERFRQCVRPVARTTIAGACALLLLSACDHAREQESIAVSPEPAPASAPEPVAPAAAADPVLSVAPEGLRLFDPASGSARPLSFGLPAEQVLAAIEASRGPAERGTNEECGAGPMEFARWPDGLGLAFQDGVFVGWSLDDRAGGVLTTTSGIGPGSSRREIEEVYQVAVEETTLGTEFSVGEVSGLLDGPGPDARITNLWAGVACLFR